MRYDRLDSFLHSETPEDRRRDLLLCGVGSLGLAVVGALLAWWLLSGGLSEGLDAFTETRRHRDRRSARAQTVWWLTTIGGIVGLLSLVLALLGLYSLAAAVMRR